MGHDHSHSHGHAHASPANTNARALTIALILTGCFMLVEVVVGVLSQSLALISDAAHMLTDVIALAIALAAQRIGRWPFDSRRTYGYRRFEILAATFNAVLLFAVAIYVFYEAILRLREPPAVDTGAMLAVAVIGLLVNLAAMRVLAAGAKQSLNMKGAYLEVWSDMLGSVGVIVGALVIRFTGWVVVDAIVAILIALWVLPRTWVLLREGTNLLLEGVPEGIDLAEVERTILGVDGVRGVHDLHVWAITTGQISLTAHVKIRDGGQDADIVRIISARLEEAHHIGHTTLQCEIGNCPNPHFSCASQNAAG